MIAVTSNTSEKYFFFTFYSSLPDLLQGIIPNIFLIGEPQSEQPNGTKAYARSLQDSTNLARQGKRVLAARGTIVRPYQFS